MIENTTARGIFYRVLDGDGDLPVLVLVMGYSGNSDSWPRRFLAALGGTFRLVLIDNRGTGRSAKPREASEYTMAAMAEDLRSVGESAGFSRFHLLGYSLGGCIALEYAHRCPESIASLSLVATTAGGDAYVPPPLETLVRLANPSGDDLIAVARSIWEVGMAKEKVDRYFDELVETITTRREWMTPRFVLGAQLAAYRDFDRAQHVQFPFPTLVMTGAADPLTPPENSRALAALIVGARLLELPEAEHFLYVDAREMFVAALRAFQGGVA